MSTHAFAQKPEKRTITAAKFKAQCLQIMNEINEKPLTFIVTKRGKPVMQVSAPAQEERPFRSIIGRTPDVKILGDIVSFSEPWPDPSIKWNRVNKKAKVKKDK